MILNPICKFGCAVMIFMAAQSAWSSPGNSNTPADGTTVSTTELPHRIPVGSADRDPETSRAITILLQRLAETQANFPSLHATGHFVGASKSFDEETSHIAVAVALNFVRPNKLAVQTRSETGLHDVLFAANGKQVKMHWSEPATSGTHPYQIIMPQPPDLASFTAHHHTGELYAEPAEVLQITVLPQLFLTPDPIQLLTTSITDYVYEGTEEISGNLCHRIRLRQASPQAVVNLWIDAENYLIRRTSLITSYDEDYNLIDSFDEGQVAEMKIMQWDTITTDPAAIDHSSFELQPPAHAIPYVRPASESWIPKPEKPSLWQALVNSAASSTDSPTTASLAKMQGNANLTLEKVVVLDDQPIEIERVRLPGESADFVAAVLPDGTVNLMDHEGTLKDQVSVGMAPIAFDVLTTSTGELLHFLALDNSRESLTAINPDGSTAWKYSYPYAGILGFEAGRRDPVVFLNLDNPIGLRKLDHTGKVIFGARSVLPANHFWDMGPEAGMLVAYHRFGRQLFDRDIKQRKSAGNIYFLEWDPSNADAPLVGTVTNSDGDVLIQRRTKDDDVIWTTTVVPKQPDIRGGAVVRLSWPASPSAPHSLLTFTSAGHVVLLDPSGNVLYRGMINADEASIQRNKGLTINHIAIGDTNGDGREEVYLLLDKTLFRLALAG